MAKVRVVFEAETSELFDVIGKTQDYHAMGVRFVSALLTNGNLSFAELVALKVYGIEIKNVDQD